MKTKKREAIIFCVILLISFGMCFNYIKLHYANDTYAIYNMGYIEYATKIFLKAGRPFSCLLLIISDKLKLPIETLVLISTIIGIVISCMSVMLIRKIIKNLKYPKDILEEIIVVTIAYCTIYNFMYIEILHFAETCILSLGIFAAIYAAYQLVVSNKCNIIRSFILLTIAVFSYNGTVGVYIVTVVLLSLLYNDGFKENIRNIIKAVILIIITIGLNFIQIKVASNYYNVIQNRLSSNIINNLLYIIKNVRKCFVV